MYVGVPNALFNEVSYQDRQVNHLFREGKMLGEELHELSHVRLGGKAEHAVALKLCLPVHRRLQGHAPGLRRVVGGVPSLLWVHFLRQFLRLCLWSPLRVRLARKVVTQALQGRVPLLGLYEQVSVAVVVVLVLHCAGWALRVFESSATLGRVAWLLILALTKAARRLPGVLGNFALEVEVFDVDLRERDLLLEPLEDPSHVFLEFVVVLLHQLLSSLFFRLLFRRPHWFCASS